MDLNAKTRLRRFCYLGSLDPVYIHLRQPIDIERYLPELSMSCQALDDLEFLQVMREVLRQEKLVRRDEALFVYAVYLSTDLDIKWKRNVRIAFPECIRDDDDVLLFCKYSMSIQTINHRKGFSRTMRRAITAWYELQSPEAIQDMWMLHRGAYGLTHKALLTMCHVSDYTIGAAGVVTPFLKTCSELLMMEKNREIKNGARILRKQKKLSTSRHSQINNEPISQSLEPSTAKAKAVKNSTPIAPSVIAMSRLRTTKNKYEALKIIKKYKLHYNQVPKHLMCHGPIMEALIPTMSYLQLLKCWRSMARFNLFNIPKILTLCQSILNNKNMLRKHNIHPIVLLLKMDKLGFGQDISQLQPKKVEAMRMTYLRDLYMHSFGHNQATGLRMRITINLQTNYIKKLLNNHKRLSYIDAAVALAFGYFKKECNVDVFYWANKTKLFPIPWNKDMTITEARECCEKIESKKNKQRLALPVLSALPQTKIYDLFLAIVPSAGRGNPGQKSEFLSKVLDKYRESKNSHAKYVIVNLRKYKRSMTYSKARVENIMEICGLDEHTTELINNFALNHFG